MVTVTAAAAAAARVAIAIMAVTVTAMQQCRDARHGCHLILCVCWGRQVSGPIQGFQCGALTVSSIRVCAANGNVVQ